MKTESRNCLPEYKIFYSCAFMLILCVIHPIIYYEEIGAAVQKPLALLTIIFCNDTYLMEVRSKRSDIFHLYGNKKQLQAIRKRVNIQMLYLLLLSCVEFFLFFWQKPNCVNESTSIPAMFGMFCVAIEDEL